MESSRENLKIYAYMAIAAMAVLFLGGIVYYKDRLFFCDASYIAFNVLKYKVFYIQEHRYGSFITQMFLYIGVKLHLPVKIILKSYAFSFNLFYLVAAWLVYRCRQYGLTIIMAMYYYLMVSDTWFWTNNEIHQAVGWMFIFLAVTLYMTERKAKLVVFVPVFLLLGFLTLYTHFIVLIPTTFLWVYLYIKKDGLKLSRGLYVILTLCLAAIVLSKFLVVNNNSYDDSHLQNVTHPSLRDIIPAIISPVIKKFVLRCGSNYWIGVIVFGAGVVAMMRKKEWGLLAWTVASFVGYMLLMGLTYREWAGDILLFHIESEWQCIGIIMATPFVFSLLPDVKVSYGVGFLALVFLVRIGYIGMAYSKFEWRTDFRKRVMAQMRKKGITKLGLIDDADLKKSYILEWALPDESILQSAIQKDEPQLTITLADTSDKKMMAQLASPRMVYAAFELSAPCCWNYEYFKPDTLRPYTIMSYTELFREDTVAKRSY